VRSALIAAAVAVALLVGAFAALVTGPDVAGAYRGSIARIDAVQAARMRGVSWRPGCPVGLGSLRVLTLPFWGFDGRLKQGHLIVHEDVAAEVLGAFRRLHAARFPIRRIAPVDAFGGSDFRSIEADNTSAFNCRYVDGTRRWSEHAYGRAIDVNPIENPYVAGGTTSHPASRTYVDRALRRPGMALEGGVLVRAFDRIGWGWGGRWSASKDYQHFSASGR
jgi:hypothetical protein